MSSSASLSPNDVNKTDAESPEPTSAASGSTFLKQPKITISSNSLTNFPTSFKKENTTTSTSNNDNSKLNCNKVVPEMSSRSLTNLNEIEETPSVAPPPEKRKFLRRLSQSRILNWSHSSNFGTVRKSRSKSLNTYDRVFYQDTSLLNDLSPMELEKIEELMLSLNLSNDPSMKAPRITVKRVILKDENSEQNNNNNYDNNSNNNDQNNQELSQEEELRRRLQKEKDTRAVMFNVKVMVEETWVRKEYDRRYKRRRRTKKEKDKIQNELRLLREELFGEPNAFNRSHDSLSVNAFNRFYNNDDDEGVMGVDDDDEGDREEFDDETEETFDFQGIERLEELKRINHN